LSSETEEHNLDDQQEVLEQVQVRHDRTLQASRVALAKKWNRADTVIASTSLPNLRYPAGAIPPPLLKWQNSTINIFHVTDIVPAQEIRLPTAGGDQSVPQPKAGGDHNIPQHQMATFVEAKRFMEAIVLTKIPWPILSDQMYSMVDKAWQLAIGDQVCQQPLAGAPVGAPSVCQLPGGPSLKIDRQTRDAVSVHSVFCSTIRVMMILNPKTIHSQY